MNFIIFSVGYEVDQLNWKGQVHTVTSFSFSYSMMVPCSHLKQLHINFTCDHGKVEKITLSPSSLEYDIDEVADSIGSSQFAPKPDKIPTNHVLYR